MLEIHTAHNFESIFPRLETLVILQSNILSYSNRYILYFPIPHNALCLPSKFCINYCCKILLRICRPPKSISQQQLMQNLGGNLSALWEWENSQYVSILFNLVSGARVPSGRRQEGTLALGTRLYFI